MGRESEIVRACVINIVGNVGLAAVKTIVGTLTGSIAITLDAINSLADAFGSIVAIIGTKISTKSANSAHPFGYGRIEYITSIIIAATIFAAGMTSLREAINSIMNPTEPTYTVVAVLIVAAAALVKFGLGAFLIREGNRLSASSLKGSGTDSFMDGGVSCATCVAAVVYMVAGLKVESWLAALIALFIIRGGIKLLMETASKLIGERVESGLSEEVENVARSVEGVKLVNSITLTDFGPDYVIGSVHVTVDGQMTVADFDPIARDIQNRVFESCNVLLSGVTPYADTPDDEDTKGMRAAIGRLVWAQDKVVDLRGLYVDTSTSFARFDVIVELGTKGIFDRRDEIAAVCEREFPGWTFEVRVLPAIGD